MSYSPDIENTEELDYVRIQKYSYSNLKHIHMTKLKRYTNTIPKIYQHFLIIIIIKNFAYLLLF